MEVQFLHEDLIMQDLAEVSRKELLAFKNSRNFYTTKKVGRGAGTRVVEKKVPKDPLKKKKPAYRPNKMVRTDHNLQAGSLEHYMIRGRPKRKRTGGTFSLLGGYKCECCPSDAKERCSKRPKIMMKP